MLGNVLLAMALVVGLVILWIYSYANKTYAKNILIVTTIVLIAIAAKKYIIPFYYAVNYESFIRSSSPVVDMIATDFPIEFDDYVKKVKISIYANEDKSQTVYYTNQLIAAVVKKYLPHATNKSVYDFSKVELAYDDKLFHIDPKLVLYHEFGNLYSKENNEKMLHAITDPDFLLKFVDAQNKLIASAINNPQPLLTYNQKLKAAEIVLHIRSNLAEKYGEDTLTMLQQNPSNPALDAQKAAEAVMSLYAQIIATGEDNTGMIWKYLFSAHDKEN